VFVKCTVNGCQVWLESLPPNGQFRCPVCSGVSLILPEGATAQESATKSHRPELTDPHRCYHCGDELENLAEARKRTVPHRDHFTAVYGIWYRCLACQRVLASPARMEGLKTRCPCCGAEVQVPHDYLFRERDEPLDDRWFAFNCLECEHQLEAMK